MWCGTVLAPTAGGDGTRLSVGEYSSNYLMELARAVVICKYDGAQLVEISRV